MLIAWNLNLHRVHLAVPYDVLGKRLGVLTWVAIVSHHLEVGFGIAVHDVADH
jgi:hypothetical protein